MIRLAFASAGLILALDAPQRPGDTGAQSIPRVWEPRAVASLELPLADPRFSPAHVTAEYYYAMPARAIYRSYPVYHPDREPAGYLDRLRAESPQIVFEPSGPPKALDWAAAGEIVFDAPNGLEPVTPGSKVRDRDWYATAAVPLAADGSVPFFRYVVREKGKVELTSGSCAECHTRVMADGSVLKGAQGNFPFERAGAYLFRKYGGLERARSTLRGLFAAPWIRPDPVAALDAMSAGEIADAAEAIPPGVLGRSGSSLFYPPQVPDLIGVQARRFLDHTGLVRQRDIGDLMRYSALNQGLSQLSAYGEYRPGGTLPEPARRSRYSDEQLYALARYLYGLEPPRNPNPSGELAARGREVFRREGCETCHTPPLYTNNKLTPVAGFTPQPELVRSGDVLPVVVGTDPSLALATRRGTGYYKVPSVRGVWYRGPFEHNGSVATLEDWFDARRLRDDYVPTGFRGSRTPTRAVKGHPFGLNLPEEERRALIAFLKTL
jgi:hypothetical protein